MSFDDDKASCKIASQYPSSMLQSVQNLFRILTPWITAKKKTIKIKITPQMQCIVITSPPNRNLLSPKIKFHFLLYYSSGFVLCVVLYRAFATLPASFSCFSCLSIFPFCDLLLSLTRTCPCHCRGRPKANTINTVAIIIWISRVVACDLAITPCEWVDRITFSRWRGFSPRPCRRWNRLCPFARRFCFWLFHRVEWLITELLLICFLCAIAVIACYPALVIAV